MNKFHWTKVLGFGLLLWAVMAVALWILGNIQALGPLWAHAIVAGVGGIVAYIMATNLKADGATQAAGYGLIFAVLIVALDLIVTQWFDAHVFASWQYWLGPALALLAPLAQVETHDSMAAHTV